MAYKARVLNPAAGGTGIANNDSSTLTISGAFAATFTLTNTTSVTFPTSGTLATTSQIIATPVTVPNGGTGVGTLTNHGVLLGQATSNVVATSAGSTGQHLQSQGASADPTWTTATFPATATGTGKVLVADGTNWVASTPTFPNASATAGKFIRSDGTNWIASTPTLPTAAGTSGKVLQSNGTNYVESTPTYPSASGTARTILVSDGTNNVYSTETWAVPGTSGNVLTSNGTNWTSATPTPVWLTASGTLTNSQVKNLHATPIQLIAAPGAGKVINIVQMVGKLAYGGTNVFTAAASQSIQAYYGTALSIANILNNAGVIASASQLSVQGGQFQASTYSSAVNAAVNAYNPIATEIGGNAANDNTVPYFIVYYIVTI